ncbi:copper resistance D family protein [Salinicoccus roseus]|uniref:copper resistance D family protein n=1 Tax=Salinicoccus roseus TaxID=45670 RepID=UPI003524B214
MTEFILYISFSILIGSLILYIIPENKKTTLKIPKKLLYLATILIPITAFFPVYRTANLLAVDLGFWFTLKNVLLTFEIGRSWLFISIVSIVLIFVLRMKKFAIRLHLKIWALAVTLLMLFGYTYSAHAATITEWQGFVVHTLHFLSITIWIGILFIISWFSRDKDNWIPFLKWFTPVAIICLIIASITGYLTMEIDIESYDDVNSSVLQDYQNSLIVNYGQALLIKHILIISLVLFAFINGFLFRKCQARDSFNPLKWTKLESGYALMIFGVTAFMGQSWPPHQIYNLIKAEGGSPLFNVLYDGDIVNIIQNAEHRDIFNVTMSFSPENYLLFVLGFLFLFLTIYSVMRKKSVFFSILFSFLMSISIYAGIILGIQ